MATLCELAAQIVAGHAETTPMKVDQLLKVIDDVFKTLEALEAGKHTARAEEVKPALTVKQAFRKDEVICMVCGKGGMKVLARHIKNAHDLKPGQYRKQFSIPSTQPLTARSYTEAKKKAAEERGLGDLLAEARAKRAANLKAKKAAPAKKSNMAKKAAAANPAKRR